MNIKDFAKQNQNKNTKTTNFNAKQMEDDYGDLVQEFLKRYGKMSEKQMLFEMFSLVKQKKEQGTFDITQIEKASKAIAPFLSLEQQDYMHQLLEQLK